MKVNYPRRQFFGIGAAVASTVALAGRPAFAATPAAGQVVEWDKTAEKEVLTLLHHMHHAWNDGDVEFIKGAVADEGFVGTFELTGNEHPVVLNSRDSLIAFVENLVGELKASGSTTEASPNRTHQVRATSTFAICTEECDLIERHADGSRSILPHRGTSALAKTADGWKFVHWHVSEGGAGKHFDAAGNPLA